VLCVGEPGSRGRWRGVVRVRGAAVTAGTRQQDRGEVRFLSLSVFNDLKMAKSFKCLGCVGGGPEEGHEDDLRAGAPLL